MIRQTIFGRKKYKPNTFIGGIAKLGGTGFSAPINSGALLATRLSIASSRIKVFKVVGENVECHIIGDYVSTAPEANTGSFENNLNITFYNDAEGLIKTLGSRMFRNATNLVNVNLPLCHTFSGEYINDNSGCFANCSNLESISAPLIVNIIGRNHFRLTPKLTYFNMLNVTSDIGFALFGGSGMPIIDVPLVTKIRQEAFAQPNNLVCTYLNIPSVVTVEQRGFYNLKALKILNIPNLISISNKQAMFSAMTNVEQINIKKLKVFGNPNDNGIGTSSILSFIAFHDIKLGCYIRVHIDLLTINSGTADVGLIWAKDNRAAIVEFYDDLGSYVSTL